ncbi:MAG: mechanosensitive ion channel family protein [Planctomycetota bacterium]
MSSLHTASDPEIEKDARTALQRVIDEFVSQDLQTLGNRVIATLVIATIALLVYKVAIRGLFRVGKRTALDESAILALRTLVRWLMVALTGAALLQAWGVLENVWAAATAVVTLIAIGFVAVWSILSNVLCGLILLANRPFRLGEYLKLGGEEAEGVVDEVTLLYTRLRGRDGLVYQVPNNMFFQKVVRRGIDPNPPAPPSDSPPDTPPNPQATPAEPVPHRENQP